MKKLLRNALAARRLRRSSPLPEPLRSQVIDTVWHLDRKKLPSPVSIAGCKVHHRGEEQLRHLFKEIFADACYFFRTETETPTIFDCGSNIGMSILFFKKLYPKARITGFEPDRVTFETLQKNVVGNALSDVTVHCYALGSSNETRKFFGASSSRLDHEPVRETQPGTGSLRVNVGSYSTF